MHTMIPTNAKHNEFPPSGRVVLAQNIYAALLGTRGHSTVARVVINSCREDSTSCFTMRCSDRRYPSHRNCAVCVQRSLAWRLRSSSSLPAVRCGDNP